MRSDTKRQFTRHFYNIQNNSWWWRNGCPAVRIKYYVTWHSNRTWYIASLRWLPICTFSHTTLHLSFIYIVVIKCQHLVETVNSLLYRMHAGIYAPRLLRIFCYYPHTPLPQHNNRPAATNQVRSTHTYGGGKNCINSRLHLFINSSYALPSIPFISLGVPLRESPMKQGKSKQSPFAQPHADRRPTYNGVRHDFVRDVQWYWTSFSWFFV